MLVSGDFTGRAAYSLDNLFSLFKRKHFKKRGVVGDYFYLGCLFQSSGVLPGFKHGIHNTVKNNPLIEQKAWERGDSRAILLEGVGGG